MVITVIVFVLLSQDLIDNWSRNIRRNLLCVLWVGTSVGKLNWLLIRCVKGLAANANCIYLPAGLVQAIALNLCCWLWSPNLTATTPNGCVGNGLPTLQTPIVMVCCISGTLVLTEVSKPWVGVQLDKRIGMSTCHPLDADTNCTCVLAWTRSATLSVWWQLRNPNLASGTHTVQWVGGR